jgi:hypothetical protein
MKRTLSFEFEPNESDAFDVIANAEKVAYAVSEYDNWLQQRVKYGFDAGELKQFEGLSSEDAASLVIEMARDALREMLHEKV